MNNVLTLNNNKESVLLTYLIKTVKYSVLSTIESGKLIN